MGKKIKTTTTTKPVEAEPVETIEHSEVAETKKENAAMLARTLKATHAAVLATFDLKQATSAAKALQEYQQRKFAESKGLLDQADTLFTLSFTMTAVPETPSQRPQLVSLPHPFYSAAENTRVCIFVKDPSREFKDQIADLDIPCIAKVIGFDKLKRNYH
jgi:hypothetical protein